MKSCQNLLQRTHPIHPIGSNTHVFFAFHSLWVHLRLFRNCKKFSAKRGELVQLMQKLGPRSHVVVFFTTNRLDPSRWTLNLCFDLFHSVCVHLRSLRNCMKLGAKRGQLVQLMQKFVPRSHVVIFLNQRT